MPTKNLDGLALLTMGNQKFLEEPLKILMGKSYIGRAKKGKKDKLILEASLRVTAKFKKFDRLNLYLKIWTIVLTMHSFETYYNFGEIDTSNVIHCLFSVKYFIC
jgi:hypothetical protein